MASKALTTKKSTALSVPSINTALATDLKKTFGEDILMSGSLLRKSKLLLFL